MNRWTSKTPLLLVLLLSACGGGGGGTCQTNADCPRGEICPAGTCQKAPALAISPNSLPQAVVGQAYAVHFTASGGVGTRTWAAKGLPPWATFAASSGELSGIPDAPSPGVQVTVTVTDSQASQQSRAYTLMVGTCQPGATASCFVAQGSACMTGTATCGSDGTMGACATGGASTDVAHCGPGCAACDATAANACLSGACACNGGAACTGGRTCCGAGGCVDLNADPANCGTCGHQCTVTDPATEVAACVSGQCVAQCAPGLTRCGGSSGACVHLDTVGNCGACGNDCRALITTSSPNGQAACQSQNGAYKCVMSCVWPNYDCDGLMSNGCEANLETDTTCGTCGNDCTQYTQYGRGYCDTSSTPLTCRMGCVGSYADCDNNLNTGCETDLDTDAQNCHSCGNACPVEPHATPRCTRGSCFPLACNAGYADCDAVPSNGCEVNVLTDPNNCGSCGSPCGSGYACQGGTCCASRGTACVAGGTCCSGTCNLNSKTLTGSCQ